MMNYTCIFCYTEKELELTRNLLKRKEQGQIHVLMMGRTGTGKSSLANVLLADRIFQERTTPDDVTKEGIQYVQRQYGNVVFHIYDTRGLFDDDKDKKDVDKKDVLEKIERVKPGFDFDVIIVCIKFTDKFDRMYREILNTVHELRPDIWSSVHIALTHTDVAVDIANALPYKKLPDAYAEERTKQWKREINEYLQKELQVHVPVPIHNTSYIDTKSNLKILKNWLPIFLLKVLCSPRLFTFHTALAMATLHKTAGPVIKRAMGEQGWFGRGDVTLDQWLEYSSKSHDTGLEEICKRLKEY